MPTKHRSLVLFLGVLGLSGCGGDAPSSSPAGAGAGSRAGAVPGASVLALAAEPAGGVPVLAAKAQGATAEPVVVVGRVKDMVPGYAAFTMTDPSLLPCAKDEGCPTPWDYCCLTKAKVAEATLPVAVRVRGEVVESPLPELRNLDLVVVRGTIVRAADGTLRLDADGWFRRERPEVAATVTFPR